MVVGDISTGTEVLIIGGGPGGYVAAIRAGQLDLDVTLVEDSALGGACLNRGCIPSKALLSATGLAHDVAVAEEMGISADPDLDAAVMTDWKDEVVDQLTGGVGKLCKAHGVSVLEGRAEFAGDHEARVVHGGDGQGAETIEFEHAIIATGSRPIELPSVPFDAEPVLDSAAALDVSDPPDSMAVIGAGYVGMELSTVFARLGTDVTVIEMLDSVLPTYAEDLCRPVRDHLEGLGVTFQFGERASDWRPAESAEATDGGSYVLETETEGGENYEYPADEILVAVGREPVTDTLNLDAIGLTPEEAGFLSTDDRARTAIEHVFAVGDVAGEPMLAHAASAEGEVAAEVIAGEPAALDAQAIPAAVFTDPEIGTVGLSEDAASEAGFEPMVGEFPLRASGRAMTLRETEGFVRIVAEADSGYILGGQAVAPEASELVAEIGLAIEMGATLEDVAGTVHAHPTLSESVMEAAKNALDEAIHTLNR